MPSSTKKRSSKVYFGRATAWEEDITGKVLATISNAVVPDQMADDLSDHYPTQAVETQVTVSENHPSWNKVRESGQFRGDIGGEFQSTKVTWEVDTTRVFSWADQTFTGPTRVVRNYRYGPIHPCSHGSPQVPTLTASSNTSLDAFGAEMVAKCKPTNSVVDASNFLGELLHEGLPKLIGAHTWKDRTYLARKASHKARAHRASDEFLNIQFGWKPIAAEVQNVARLIASADDVIRQYQRDSGRVVRRRFSLPPIQSTTYAPIGSHSGRAEMCAPSSSLFWRGSAQGEGWVKTEVSTRRWFSGAFTYYFPADGNVYSKMRREAQMAKKTLGLTLTPEVVWNLTPWSWAVDWFTNTGDVISNLTDWAVDGLCLRYGYVMEHKMIRRTYFLVGDTSLKIGSYRPSPIVVTKEIKTRRKANPFGFGLTWNGLTTTQAAIAAALGIKRS